MVDVFPVVDFDAGDFEALDFDALDFDALGFDSVARDEADVLRRADRFGVSFPIGSALPTALMAPPAASPTMPAAFPAALVTLPATLPTVLATPFTELLFMAISLPLPCSPSCGAATRSALHAACPSRTGAQSCQDGPVSPTAAKWASSSSRLGRA